MSGGFYLENSGAVTLLRSGLFDGSRISHAFSTRLGGVSVGEYSSMNLRFSCGDSPESVGKNYEVLASAVGFELSKTARAKQIHGDTVRVVREYEPYMGNDADCDALITNLRGQALMVFAADCVPVLLCDPATGAVGAVHAGWRGTANGIVKNAVLAMNEAYGALPENILCAIGPCISAEQYEVGGEVAEALETALSDTEGLLQRRGEKWFPDLRELNRLILRRAGVKPKNIAVSDMCTNSNAELFWSHRRDGNARGVQCGVIAAV